MNKDSILESISDGVFTVDADWRVTYLNRSAEKLIGVSRKEAVGRLCCEVFRSNLCEGACALRKTLEQDKPIIDLSCTIIDNRGRRVPVSISTAVLRDESGNIVGGAETFRSLSDIEELRNEIVTSGHTGGLVSRSPSMRGIIEQLPAVAETASTVLITGETGSGKEMLARAIHAAGPRAGKPFVAINCGALPETLLESELFGYKKGAFTGADRDKPGRFALAGGGTLFLDEIGEISPAMQVRLLRVLQERSYEPLGSVASEKFAARIVCATHRDLDELVAAGDFRQDLFYRINVIRLELPPLRDRREDIPFLVDTFIRRFNLVMGRQVSGVSSSVMRTLTAYRWPGNVRELENLIERSMVFCRGDVVGMENLPPGFAAAATPASDVPSAAAGTMTGTVKASELQAILNALSAANGNRRQAAEMLGIHRATLYRKVRELGIDVSLPDGRRRK
ncbi:MAG: sigma-54 interaction domain-containing protein [Victivallaceae bacterium]